MKTKKVQKSIGNCRRNNVLSIAFSVVFLFALFAQNEAVYGSCSNVTSGGTICGWENRCYPYDPCKITSGSPACGGSGTLEYRWQYSTDNCQSWICIPNSNNVCYDPCVVISQTVWYKRQARRTCCSTWTVCSNIIKKEVGSTPSATITADGPTTFCKGGSVGLSAPNCSNASYLWSNGATTRCITVNCSGNYAVTVTTAQGCSSTCTKCVTVNPLPNSEISGNTAICDGEHTTLSAPAGCNSYLWSNGKTTQCITVCDGGNYCVTVWSNQGCSSTSHVYVTEYAKPVCCITGNLYISHGSSTTLKAPLGCNSYLWSNGATTRCITVSCAGNYCVTVTNANGCSNSCSVCVKWCASRGDDLTVATLEGTNSIESSVYPNPFNETATFEFTNYVGNARTVVEVYGIDGAKIGVLFNEETTLGEMHRVNFDAADYPSGLYLYRITCGDQVVNGRMIHN